MKPQITSVFHRSTKCLSRLALAAGLILPVPLMQAGPPEHTHAAVSPKLVKIVRDATRQYQDVNVAIGAGYGPFLGCVSGPDHGAMGVHYVNGPLVVAGLIDVSQPEALIYEPLNGRLRLVGVEFIVDAATWLANHNGNPPVLEGQSFLFVGSPNRYGIPAFFELH